MMLGSCNRTGKWVALDCQVKSLVVSVSFFFRCCKEFRLRRTDKKNLLLQDGSRNLRKRRPGYRSLVVDRMGLREQRVHTTRCFEECSCLAQLLVSAPRELANSNQDQDLRSDHAWFLFFLFPYLPQHTVTKLRCSTTYKEQFPTKLPRRHIHSFR